MNKNISSAILVVVAIGIFFTYTDGKYKEVKNVLAVSAAYDQALKDADDLIRKRDQVITAYNNISVVDRQRLEDILPDNIDNVRLIIDVRNLVAKRGVNVKNIKTSAANLVVNKDQPKKNTNAQYVAEIATPDAAQLQQADNDPIESVNLSFSFNSDYDTFLTILDDLQKSLRVMEITKVTLTPSASATDSKIDTGKYDFALEIKTFWLKQ